MVSLPTEQQWKSRLILQIVFSRHLTSYQLVLIFSKQLLLQAQLVVFFSFSVVQQYLSSCSLAQSLVAQYPCISKSSTVRSICSTICCLSLQYLQYRSQHVYCYNRQPSVSSLFSHLQYPVVPVSFCGLALFARTPTQSGTFHHVIQHHMSVTNPFFDIYL